MGHERAAPCASTGPPLISGGGSYLIGAKRSDLGCFNGSAADQRRRGPPPARRPCPRRCFNGSAADQRRRGNCTTSPPMSSECFNGSAADQRRRVEQLRRPAAERRASTGPPLISGGGKAKRLPHASTKRRFNGSAADQRRRVTGIRRGERRRRRFNGSAADQRRRASVPLPGSFGLLLASTGPPLISGGGPWTRSIACTPAQASTGPPLISGGGGPTTRPYAARSACFNGSAADQRRRDSPSGFLFGDCVMLQRVRR